MSNSAPTTARCVSCGRLVPTDEIGAPCAGFLSLCYCETCEREQQQGQLELQEARQL